MTPSILAQSPAELAPRQFLHSAKFRRTHPAARAFLAPQRPRVPKVQHPKPERANLR